MKKVTLFALLLLAALTVSQASPNSADQHRIAKAISDIAIKDASIIVYSIDFSKRARTDVTNKKYFHGFKIDGQKEIKNGSEKTSLISAFIEGVRDSKGWEAECFNPRHGLRVIKDSKTVDFVICFECLQVDSYGFAYDHFLTTDLPAKAFETALARPTSKP